MAAAIQAVKDGQSRLRPHVEGIEDLRRDQWDEIPSKVGNTIQNHVALVEHSTGKRSITEQTAKPGKRLVLQLQDESQSRPGILITCYTTRM